MEGTTTQDRRRLIQDFRFYLALLCVALLLKLISETYP